MTEERIRALWASVLLVSVKDARDWLKKNKTTVMPDGLEIPRDAGEAFNVKEHDQRASG